MNILMLGGVVLVQDLTIQQCGDIFLFLVTDGECLNTVCHVKIPTFIKYFYTTIHNLGLVQVFLNRGSYAHQGCVYLQ